MKLLTYRKPHERQKQDKVAEETLRMGNPFLPLAILSLLAMSCIATGTTLRVPEDFATIQAAIDAAEMGDQIVVATGQYSEHIEIEKDLKLIGVDLEKTVIRGIGKGSVISIRGCQVSISGFSITGAEYRGMYSEGLEIRDAQVIVRDCAIFNNHGTGVQAIGDSKIKLNNCTIRQNDSAGIDLQAEARAEIAGCTIWNNHTGVIAYGEAQVSIGECIIKANKWDGIELQNAVQATISNCTIQENFWGLSLSHDSEAEISDCVIEENWKGVWLRHEAQVLLIESTIRNNADDGISIWDTAQLGMNGGLVIDNHWAGISLANTGGIDLRNVEICNNRLGIMVQATGCDVYWNAFVGSIQGTTNQVYNNTEADLCPAFRNALWPKEFLATR